MNQSKLKKGMIVEFIPRVINDTKYRILLVEEIGGCTGPSSAACRERFQCDGIPWEGLIISTTSRYRSLPFLEIKKFCAGSSRLFKVIEDETDESGG